MFQLGILLVLSSRHMWLPRSLKSAIKRYLNITPFLHLVDTYFVWERVSQ
jgi:hypothetical protein